jgi:hypothetical protein
VSVRDFGAVGNGVANDTAAIQAAIDWAYASTLGGYWGTIKPSVYIPAGRYFHSGIDIPPRVTVFGDGPGQVQLVLRTAANRSNVKFTAAASTEPAQENDYNHAALSGVLLEGNASAQAATSHGIEFANPGYSIGTRYCVAGKVEDVTVIGARDSGIGRC